MVDGGLAIGVHDAALLSPVAGDHAHDAPPEPVSAADPPTGMVVEPPATARGSAFTVTVTVGLFVDDWP
jgi:hypothetical protein